MARLRVFRFERAAKDGNKWPVPVMGTRYVGPSYKTIAKRIAKRNGKK